MASEWQPIDSAPKDGTKILAYFAAETSMRYSVVFWSSHFKEWYGVSASAAGVVGGHIPTHWQPLPDPPEGVSQ